MFSILTAKKRPIVWFFLISQCLLGCDVALFNNPYPAQDAQQSILYAAFAERPKHLDPAVAYSSDEYGFIGQIYEPPLQYHYLHRPYQLEPLTAQQMPVIRYLDAQYRVLANDADPAQIAYSEYTITIKPGILYQPHPAFFRDQDDYPYHHLDKPQLEQMQNLQNFARASSRELTAEDYVYQIKRLAYPKIQSPIAELMAGYIDGFSEFAEKTAKTPIRDLKNQPMRGVEALSPLQSRMPSSA